MVDVILTKSETRAILRIENEGEKDLRFHPYFSEFRAIQNKRQFIVPDFLYNETQFPSIPPGIEEGLVVIFEGIDPSEYIISFRFGIDLVGVESIIRFKFTVQVPP